MVVLDVLLMALVSFAIVTLLVWSIITQHRDPMCAHLRIRHRLRVSISFNAVDGPRAEPEVIVQRGLVI